MRSRETEFCVYERERYFRTRVIAREKYEGTQDISRERECVSATYKRTVEKYETLGDRVCVCV